MFLQVHWHILGLKMQHCSEPLVFQIVFKNVSQTKSTFFWKTLLAVVFQTTLFPISQAPTLTLGESEADTLEDSSQEADEDTV